MTSTSSPAADLSTAAAILSALASPDRLALIGTIAVRTGAGLGCSVAELVTATGADFRRTAKTVGRLVECRVAQIDDGGTVVLRPEGLADLATALEAALPATALLADFPDLRPFFRHGRLASMPEDPDRRSRLARLLVELVPVEVELDESAVNDRLRAAGDDVAELRRLLVDEGLLTRRAGRGYRRPDCVRSYT